ncbi:MAG: trigger factor [Parcubacteria group bacterium]|nr:trigger factor [Parcubacteria group bacterium]|tara:strand:- start:969 stop:2255 length:1287 start_codon:yes stop_codon:yes gene_type:complete
MKVETKKLERGEVELNIELTVEEYQPFLEIAAKKISETSKVPGFRPGKAGFEIIKQKVGEGQIWQEALEPAVQKTFLKALDEQKLVTVGSPQIDVVKLAPGNPVAYKVKISLLPNVELGDYSKIKVTKKETVISDEQLQKVLSDLQKRHAKETLTDKKIAVGNKAEIDFEIFLDKVPIDNGKQQKFPLVIGEKTFIPGFEEKIIGLGKDDTKEFQLEFPKEYHQKNLAGKLADFKVKVIAVYDLQIPELNDDLAKSLGDFKNLQELKDKIKENLTAETKAKEDQKFEEEIIDKIIGESTFDDIPNILVDSETKKMVEELEHNLSHQGIKFEDYLGHIKKKREDLLLDFAPQAIKRVKSALIMRKVGKTENIKLEEAEIDLEIKKTLEAYAGNAEAEKNLKQPAYRDYLKNILTARKVMEHLKATMAQS